MSKSSNVACTSYQNENFKGEKLIYPAASRNKEPILQVLKRFIINDTDSINEDSPIFVEIATGSEDAVSSFISFVAPICRSLPPKLKSF
ncbi:unnamed protein product, partial [Iphiclides podalirius]